ncbi:DUF946 domain-containing protein [Sphingobacteriales bacterium UPWRP_1]|nr:hypothetical protein BVG80_03600 [Sphingobacteriales bacterium TSM_CSM]PSJ75680.1 DUF946 domain-containing protein [Sphingobacteriales bacterium UPWRP_1]
MANNLFDNNSLSSEFFYIEMKEVTQNGKVWDDSGSGADKNIAVWRVDPSPGFYSLGHYATLFHDFDPNRGQNAPVAITLKPKPGYEYLLQAPIGFDKIWDDAGSGGNNDCNIWRMKCPDGYVAMGDIVSQDGNNPDIGSVRCIKKSAVNALGETVQLVANADYIDFAAKGASEPKPFWDDSGSGAKKDVSIWLLKASGSASAKNQVYLSTGTFKAGKFHHILPADNAYALVLNFPQNDIMEKVEMSTKKVKLKGNMAPTEEEMKASEIVQEYFVPFFAVQDPDYKNPLEQFRVSPYYKIRRITRYEVIDSYEPVNTETKQFSVMIGKNEESNYNNEIGVTLGVSVTAGGKAGVPLVAEGEVSVTASIEASYSHSWGGATSNYEERTFMYPQTVTGGCFGVLFQAKSTYTIYRTDGTPLGSPVKVNINEFYTDEWKPASLTPAATSTPAAEGNTVKTVSVNTITFTIEAPVGKTIILEGRLEIRDGQLTSMPSVTTVPASITTPAPTLVPVGKTMVFDASTPPMIVNNKLSRSYTKEAWIKIAADNTGGNNIISGGVSGFHAFWINNRKVCSGHNDVWDAVKCEDAVSEGWEHYAVTYDADTQEMKLYKNGKLVSSAKDVPAYGGGNFVQLARWSNSGGDGNIFKGEMAEVRIWNSALTAEQIAAQMNVAMPKATKGLIARYPDA